MLTTVIICTYRRPHLLPRAIRSVLGQTYRNLELIVIDDCSQDETASVVAQFADLRVSCHVNESNLGLPASRNAGLRLAKGELVAFLDDDDEWLPEKLSLQVALLDATPSAGACWSYQRWVHDDGRVVDRRIRLNGSIHAKLLMHDIVMMQPLLVRKDALIRIGGFDPKLRCFEDYDMSLRLSQICEFVTVEETLVVMHSTPYSMSKDTAGSLMALEYLLVKHVEMTKGRPGSRWFCRAAGYSAALGLQDKKRFYVTKSWRCAPVHVPSLVRVLVLLAGGPELLKSFARMRLRAVRLGRNIRVAVSRNQS